METVTRFGLTTSVLQDFAGIQPYDHVIWMTASRHWPPAFFILPQNIFYLYFIFAFSASKNFKFYQPEPEKEITSQSHRSVMHRLNEILHNLFPLDGR